MNPPGTGDPSVVGSTGSAPPEWAAAQQPQTPGGPMMPMMPPATPGAGSGPSSAERPDAAGLLSGDEEQWDHPADVVAGEPGGSPVTPALAERWAEAEPGGAFGVPVLPIAPPPAGPGEKRRREEAKVVPLAGFPLPEQDPAVGQDRVAVVSPADGDEDFSAWDAATAGGLGWLASSSPRRREDEQVPESPDYTLRETTPWGHTSGRTGMTRLSDEPDMIYIDNSGLIPKFVRPESGLVCSGKEFTEEELAEAEGGEEQEEADEPERTSADLLKQDEAAWADTRPKVAPGVIE